MPSAYRHNFTTGEIRHNRRRVGSVRRDGDAGLYTATIYERGQRHEFVARDAMTAFREAAARAMGFANLACMRAVNADIRARNRRARVPALVWASPSRAVPAFNHPVDMERLISQLQADAIACGETPLTAEEIRATWSRGPV